MPGDIGLADSVAERCVDRGNASLVACALRWSAVERGAIKGKTGIIECLGEDAGGGVDAVEHQPVLPGLQRLAADQRREPGHGRRLPGVEFGLVGQFRCGPECLPINSRRLCRNIGARPQRDLVGIEGVDNAGMGLRHAGFQRHDARGAHFGFADSGEAQQLGDIGLIGRADLRHLGRRRQIVIAVGKAKATLDKIRHRRIGPRQPLRDEQSEQVFGGEVGGVENIGIGAQARAQQSCQLGLVLQRRHFGECRRQRCQPARFDAGGIGEGGVVIGDAALGSAGGGVFGRGIGDQRGGACLGDLEDFIADTGR